MAEPSKKVDHSAVHGWAVRFSLQLFERFDRGNCAVTGRRDVDETYIEDRGKPMHLYHPAGRIDDTAKFLVSKDPDLPTAERFLRKTLTATIDGDPL